MISAAIIKTHSELKSNVMNLRGYSAEGGTVQLAIKAVVIEEGTTKAYYEYIHRVTSIRLTCATPIAP